MVQSFAAYLGKDLHPSSSKLQKVALNMVSHLSDNSLTLLLVRYLDNGLSHGILDLTFPSKLVQIFVFSDGHKCLKIRL